ncbi:hypothetical protein [Allopontixanthobacter sediminis]|uniref:Uncharacterized protein n=1 Tax=Allopontixanthobacter sediminis TaxID=1689985 RepID=A0A845B057_9SPHN|nr:hypothetical protein [Allopontixanthobacter sediminis]MXP43524.1 hypothetical protein [Allopontixanthobacter sediminis]
MNYPNIMRNAARILFLVAAAIFIGSLLFSLLLLFGFGPVSAPGGALALVIGGVTMAIPPFVGAAIVWRLDIWLFERGNS